MIRQIKKFVKKFKKGEAQLPEVFKILSNIRKDRENLKKYLESLTEKSLE